MLRLGTWAGLSQLSLIVGLLGLVHPYKMNSFAMGLQYTWAFVVRVSCGKISIVPIDFVEEIVLKYG